MNSGGRKKLSIIIPVYFNEENLRPLYADLEEKLFSKLCERGWDYELVMVDDGSGDASYEIMQELKAQNDKIVTVKLSRNFGSHSAILAGLSVCGGDCAAMKAADLQEPTEMILEMLDEYEKGNKVVLAVREGRDEGFSQKFFASAYYSMVRRFALPNMPQGGFDCFLIDRQVVGVLNAMEEKNTSLMGQILWSGFKTSTVRYIRRERQAGKSRWTFRKKLKLVADSLFGFSYFPVQFISGAGIVLFLAAIVWLIIIVVNRLVGNIPIAGYTTLAVILLGGFGVILLALGIIGEYIWRMFDATRKRPVFIIDEKDAGDKKERE